MSARTRLLNAATAIIRRQGFAGTSVDGLCGVAGVTKGAFFHHFASKEALGVAAAEHWSETTGALFAGGDWHRHADPLQRIFGYIDFRAALIAGAPAEFTCLAGTMVQEAHESSPAIRDACRRSIFGHAATLEADFAAAMAAHGVTGTTAESLALHTQAVLQGGFILSKATGDTAPSLAGIDHLRRYLTLLFGEKCNDGDNGRPVDGGDAAHRLQ
ncbi:TetR/AcrR family transcriptional regulator [Polymorphobacter fuscus]|uniref:TetR family transcriptional regulator n=1 Tax=Sandarakinorhabdus fusca TaxID=1439888 RepID=A0A7C9GVL2_9SPHN|nr:TetR/AcrR family transcriptional regulator [Polymorphobacter fuscus]KAB7646186.1 TetR/AcrR family transcriptional regulator [Polymorphobacter fuscus]MQT17389.1 TetR family transcriptional regulator [Polymorphobacter fuscus]NJC10077.1 TetR/AcrR family transcriptional repressor of nem operon [Polymorphobacter fuscus]